MTLTLSIIINVFLIILWYKQKKYTKTLFKRAWRLELCLMYIYNTSTDTVKKEIEKTIGEISPI